jgi:hypothetical protein
MTARDAFTVARHAAGLCAHGGRDMFGRYMYCALTLGHAGRCYGTHGGTLRRGPRY